MHAVHNIRPNMIPTGIKSGFIMNNVVRQPEKWSCRLNLTATERLIHQTKPKQKQLQKEGKKKRKKNIKIRKKKQ